MTEQEIKENLVQLILSEGWIENIEYEDVSYTDPAQKAIEVKFKIVFND